MNEQPIEDHDRGLAHDLKVISTQIMERRRALAWLTSAGATVLVAGCGGGSGSSSSGTTSSTSSSTSSTSSGSTSTSSGSTTTTSGTCVADPTETGGPYPADGTNSSNGSTSNVLTSSGVVRSDIRSSFISSTTTAAGVAVTFTITVVNVNASCAPLAGYAIYLWHCDRDGEYSLYDLPTESYLRGVQVTDANGQATFTTIFPGCYAGRYPHMHFEVFASLSTATSGRNAVLTSQFAMPSAVCSTLYNSATGYSASVSRFANVSTASDNVFGDNSAAQIAAQTPSMSGSVSAGYTAAATVGIAV